MEIGLNRLRGVRRGGSAESAVPGSALADDLVTAVQPLLTAAILLMCLVTVDPLGLTGRGLYGSLLLLVNAAVALTRTVPDRLVPDRARLSLAAVGAVTSGLFFGYDSSSFAPAFAFVIAMHVGIRFEARLAVSLTALSAGIAMVLLLGADDPDAWPWWTTVFLFGTVLGGIARRNREQTLEVARQVVEQTHLAAASEARAQTLAERARVAREIHDVLAHSLSGVNMQLSLADALFEAGRVDDGRDAVRRSRALVVDGLNEARRAVQALREDTIDLVPTLERMVGGEHESLEVVGSPVALPADRTVAVVRTAQEALTNARRHAPGAPIRLLLSYDGPPGVVRLDVLNGPSSAAPSSEGSGMGLVGMRERAALVGAIVSAGPAEDGGWRVRLDVPAGPDTTQVRDTSFVDGAARTRETQGTSG